MNTLNEQIEEFLKSGGTVQHIPTGVGTGKCVGHNPYRNAEDREGEKEEHRNIPTPQHDLPSRYRRK